MSNRKFICAFKWHQGRWPWMTLNCCKFEFSRNFAWFCNGFGLFRRWPDISQPNCKDFRGEIPTDPLSDWAHSRLTYFHRVVPKRAERWPVNGYDDISLPFVKVLFPLLSPGFLWVTVILGRVKLLSTAGSAAVLFNGIKKSWRLARKILFWYWRWLEKSSHSPFSTWK